ncbi:hypothetical protein [Pedobacter sp. N23S346]
MKNSKTTPAEKNKATATKDEKAKGSAEKVTSAKDAKKVEVTKDKDVKHN